MLKKPFFYLSLLFGLILVSSSFSQVQLIDQVVGTVGHTFLKQSDVEVEAAEYMKNGYYSEGDVKCDVFENQLQQKLLVNQAMVDSLPLSDADVDAELGSRVNAEIAKAGSVDNLEKLTQKSINIIRDDLRKSLRDMMLMQKMQHKVVEDIKITPTEVADFYEHISKDSLPMINEQVELAQLAMYPAYAEQSILDTKNKLLDLRKQILDGKNFGALATLYSEDEGTARSSGETNFLSKAELDPEYAKAAFALSKPGEISRIVESQFGYHLIQLIEKKSDKVNTRHILMKPKPDPKAVVRVKQSLDSVANSLRKDSILWDKAVMYYSMDENTRLNKGYLVNPQTGNTKFEVEQLVPADYYVIKNLKVGAISDAYESRDKNGRVFYKIVILKSRIPSHRANLKDDYPILQAAAKNKKMMSVLSIWFAEKQKTTAISIDPSFKKCDFKSKGWIKESLN